MLEQSVRVHDRYQIEIKLDYRIDRFDTPTSHDVAVYFFVPASLGIGPKTYARQDFYGDLLSHIRIKTPSIPLQGIVDGAGSPLTKLRSAVTKLAERPTPQAIADFEYHLKMSCCIIKSALRDHVHAVRTRRSAADVNTLVEQFCRQARSVCEGLRGLRSSLNAPTIDAKTFARYLFGDEFVSLTVEWYAYQLLESLLAAHGEAYEQHKPDLLSLVQDEIGYRKESAYPSVPQAAADNEVLVFRKSVLKKYVENVLFLAVRSRREGTVAEQTAFAVAAGLSMVFATTIAFLFQRRYGNLTFAFFVALVISYMLKDRLKDALRAFFDLKLRRFFFDRRLSIFGRSSDSKDEDRIGVCRESVEFVRESELPSAIWKLRDRDHITEVENGWIGERVILYRKRMKLYPGWFRRIQDRHPVEGLNDIIRVNFSRYLQRMDNPRKPLWLSDGRVYHINLILEYGAGSSLELSRFRVVLNKDGIKRVEPVVAERPSSPAAPEDEWGDWD